MPERDTPDDWLYNDWMIIACALRAYAASEHCTGIDVDTIDELLEAIRHYWDLSPREFGSELQ